MLLDLEVYIRWSRFFHSPSHLLLLLSLPLRTLSPLFTPHTFFSSLRLILSLYAFFYSSSRLVPYFLFLFSSRPSFICSYLFLSVSFLLCFPPSILSLPFFFLLFKLNFVSIHLCLAFLPTLLFIFIPLLPFFCPPPFLSHFFLCVAPLPSCLTPSLPSFPPSPPVV